ncbi:MAG TPA: DUF4832 domain-containing protein [Phototrophicaceae bacterium]|nr:DUF4832 domain-containing protein [Phototrophicaceae bacterium]
MRRMRASILISICVIYLLSVKLPVYSQTAPITTITYTASDELFANPERGFYHQDTPMWLGDERDPLTTDILTEGRREGITMRRWYFLMDEYRETALDTEILAYIESQFTAARAAGVKIIPRFAYNFPEGGEYPYQEPDAALEQVLAHIDQLTPILQQNSDVIAFMEIGFVGAWGEWHSSTHHLIDEETGINAQSTAIINRLLTALPPDRMIAMRYPPYKQQLYGTEPLTEATAFSGSPQSRMGAHNDCFLASDTDWGTYSEDAAERETQRRYLNADNRYLPQGGETCNAAEDAQPYIGCENVLHDLDLLRFSTLNLDYHTGVLDGWREQGCFDEIAQRLGYRLRLIEAQIPTSAQAGGDFSVNITLINEGFASPYNPRNLELILRATADGQVYTLPLKQPVDPRFWLPDAGAFTVTLATVLPAALPDGEYEVLLSLPDPRPSLASRPEYAIRLANARVWEAETGFNRLLAMVDVTGQSR